MQFPRLPGLGRPLRTLADLAGFIRDRLAEVVPRRNNGPRALTDGPNAAQAATVIVAAAAPFAPSSFARARLLRQMHASGLLTQRETEQAEQLLGVAQSG
ncbi:MAG TPA: hypothetical protein VGH43_17535 [Jatrophihabitans sp.]